MQTTQEAGFSSEIGHMAHENISRLRRRITRQQKENNEAKSSQFKQVTEVMAKTQLMQELEI